MFRKIELKMAPAEKGGGGGGQKGSTAMDEVLSDEDLATRGGEEDLEEDTKGADRGDVVPGAEKEDDEEEVAPAKADAEGEEEEEEPAKGKKGKADAEGEEAEEEPKAKRGKADAEGEEEEEEAEEPAKDKKAEKGKGKNQDLIPRSRYNSLRQRFDRLLERVEKDAPAEGGEEAEEDTTATAKVAKGRVNPLEAIDSRLEAIDDELEKAADDNDKAKIRALRKEERQLGAKRTEILVAGASTAASRQAVEQSRYDTVVEAIEEEFPWLNPDNREAEDPAEKFNPKLAREVREMTAGFEAVGYSPSKALMKAMKYFSGDDRTPKKGAVEDDVDDESLRKNVVKRKTDVVRNIETANKTPPSMRKAGADSDKAGTGKEGKINVARLTDDDFAKLPESTKARLRGDEV